MTSNQLLPALVLHRQRYRDSSLLLELFTPDLGRVGAIARGALSGKRNFRGALLQPFTPLWVTLAGRGELRTLAKLEQREVRFPLQGKQLYCGFYINELLVCLTARDDAQERLFARYEKALRELTERNALDQLLREFELQLLAELGYRMELELEAGSGRPLDPDAWYQYLPDDGPVRSLRSEGIVQGRTLLDLADGKLLEAEQVIQARNLMRSVLNYRLGGRALKSRELFVSTSRR